MRFFLLSVVLFCFPAYAQTAWNVYGQSEVAGGTFIDNPTPNNNSIGEQATLPYVVPAGYHLWLKKYRVEAYNCPGTVVLVPWLGVGPATNAVTLESVASWARVTEINPDFNLPSGTILNFRLENGQPATCSNVFSWGASGELLPN